MHASGVRDEELRESSPASALFEYLTLQFSRSIELLEPIARRHQSLGGDCLANECSTAPGNRPIGQECQVSAQPPLKPFQQQRNIE